MKELIYTAFDASATHMYVPGLRQHIENALGYGATPAEVMEVFELASTIGIHGYARRAADPRSRSWRAEEERMAFAGLAGKVAVVTGAGSGIGAGRRAAALGRGRAASWSSTATRSARATVAGELGGDALAVAADVSQEEGVGAYMDAAVERFGRIDLYHLNAGIAGTPVPIPEIEAHEFDEVMAVNVRGVFLGLRDAFRQYERQGSGGAIV